MTMRRLAFLAVLGTAAVLLPVACVLLGVSIDDRIEAFQNDLNEFDRSDVYLNFHPKETTDYGAITGDGFLFDFNFDEGFRPYTITIVNQSNPASVTAIIDAADIGFGGPFSIVFKMAQLGEDWMIEELNFDSRTLVIE